MGVYYKVPEELGIIDPAMQIVPTPPPTPSMSIDPAISIMNTSWDAPIFPQKFWEMEKTLSCNLKDKISQFPDLGIPGDKVIKVYNPLVYASEPHRDYLMKYCGPKDVLFVGMNPGRNGMGQNGIPFGDPTYVWNWLNITGEGTVELPPGLQCQNREESGHRFWELMRKKFKEPENFFQHCFVHNYCPLLFVNETGSKSISIYKIPPENWEEIQDICDDALKDCIDIIDPKIVVGIGNYAYDRIQHVEFGHRTIRKIQHPSPTAYMAPEDWEEIVNLQLQKNDIPELKSFDWLFPCEH